MAQADFGRGCGTDGMYRPVVRIDLETGAEQAVAEWSGSDWAVWDKEQWRLQDDAKLTSEGYQYKVTGKDGTGFFVEPGRGLFGDGGRGDKAFTYFSAYKPEEGEQDTVTLGSCCNKDYKQGPEQFIEPAEPLQDKDVVLWYVPQMKNDGNPGSEYCWADTRVKDGVQNIELWPCWSGRVYAGKVIRQYIRSAVPFYQYYYYNAKWITITFEIFQAGEWRTAGSMSLPDAPDAGWKSRAFSAMPWITRWNRRAGAMPQHCRGHFR